MAAYQISSQYFRHALEGPAGRKLKRVWPDVLNLTIGGWMVLSAFVPAFSGPVRGRLASGLTGALVVAISIMAIRRVRRWKESVILILGLWLIAAPFVLDIGGKLNPILNFTIDGGLLALLAAFQILHPPQHRSGAI